MGSHEYHREPIAIVGSSCRFPGPATSPSKLWELLERPYDIATEVPKNRFNIDGFYHPDGSHHGTFNTREAYFLKDDHRTFDASFFHIHPREAETMDPQQRLLLEVVYEALESAGATIEGLQGSPTSVFVGGMSYDFRDTLAVRDAATIPEYSATGTHASILAARISYFFDWKGPSMSIDTACSSSLVAVHQAIQSLRTGEATVAVAAGSNLNIGPEQYIALSNLNMLSPNGRVRMWDQAADGYARGEGFGAVMLKTLRQAEADGDQIECIIRESGVNQDGKTTGITMPSADSQTSLIRQVYKRAGLDIDCLDDQPQYFEAHGTGTPAGDPIEAEAIYSSFRQSRNTTGADIDTTLYVGSIKTVTGHLEGAAGIAGLLKASLAVQHAVIPPNLHFESLNPKIAPFYGSLTIPTKAVPWPTLKDGSPRRASVNSFGFGGTNAHVIVESYLPRQKPQPRRAPAEPTHFTPLLLSAKSQTSLQAQTQRLLNHLEHNPELNFSDLLYTMQSKRSRFAYKTSFVGRTKVSVMSALNERVRSPIEGTRCEMGHSRTLGIFTGQGAQHARMGEALIENSAGAASRLATLEHALASLPDPPAWSLRTELLAASDHSRVGEAALSQPLCTALQIIILDHLSAAGVKLDAVVGHSSGEMAAAYAAGYISAEDAVRIAYYRGLHAKHAGGTNGKKGGMMACGLSFEAGVQLCSTPKFAGRVSVAASNGPAMVTLSGDLDAIDEVKEVLDGQKTFARKLVIDTAYHSFHMRPCADAYKASLEALNIQVAQHSSSCTWISSVYASGNPEEKNSLNCDYWVDNLTNTVLFSQAIQTVVQELGTFDIALEVGPHPALKGPATETLLSCGSPVPYHGSLCRGKDSIEAMAETLAFLWEHAPSSRLQFESYHKFCTGDGYIRPEIVKDLPTYSWDHEKTLYRESAASKRYLQDPSPTHELLGKRLPDESDFETRWRNIVSLKEIPWIEDHQVQDQAVIPAMFYLCMAIEAAHISSARQHIASIEVRDFVIHKPLTIENNSSLETVFSLKRDTRRNSDDTVVATFSCVAGRLHANSPLDLIFEGQVLINSSREYECLLARDESESSMVAVDPDQFYDYLEGVGYAYSNAFRSLDSIQKQGDTCKSQTARVSTPLHIHPALLDLGLQSLLAAHYHLGDDGCSPLLVPNAIRRMVINPDPSAIANTWTFYSEVTDRSPSGMCGEIEAFSEAGSALLIFEGLSWKPLTANTSESDRKLFAKTVWESDICDGPAAPAPGYSSEEEELVMACDRAAWFYYRQFKQDVTLTEWESAEEHHRRLLAYLDYILPQFANGAVPTLRAEWQHDTIQDISALMDTHAGSADLELIKAVGESLPTSIKQKRPMLEFMMEGDVLTNYYKHGLGYQKAYGILETMVHRITHRYPHMRVLEVGAGTGGATSHVLKAMNGKFASYTFTDVSSGFFEKAQDAFADYGSKMDFKIFDLEADPLTQGYEASTFDLIVGSLVVHATKSIQDSLRYIRKLLKPGGYLVLLEGSEKTLRSGFMMSGLPGWWLGGEDRKWGPMVEPSRWDAMLRETGYSGIETITQDSDQPYLNLGYAFVSQAVDAKVELLRSPLGNVAPGKSTEGISIICGGGVTSKQLQGQLSKVLTPWFADQYVAASLNRLDDARLCRGRPVLYLAELDEPVFKSITGSGLERLQRIFSSADQILIINELTSKDLPYSNALLGLVRSLRLEMPHLSFQSIAVSQPEDCVEKIAEAMIRFHLQSAEKTNDILWSIEPELRLSKESLLLPRIVHNPAPIERINSLTRAVYQVTNPQKVPVAVGWHNESAVLETIKKSESHQFEKHINVEHVTVGKFRVGSTGVHLAVGADMDTSARVIACLDEAQSMATVQEHLTRSTTVGSHEAAQYLSYLAYLLVAQDLLEIRFPGKCVMIQDAPPAFRKAIECVLDNQSGSKSVFSSSTKDDESLYVYAQASRRQLNQLLGSKDVEVFLDCSDSGVSEAIAAACPDVLCLHPFAEDYGSKTLFLADNLESSNSKDTGLAMLDLAITRATQMMSMPSDVPVILPDDLDLVKANEPSIQVMDWTQRSHLSVKVNQVADTFRLFSDKKSYILVGLTGNLGQKLCEWMVDNGARFVIMTSRNPQVSPKWIEALSQMGATVLIRALDVCSKDAIRTLKDEITTVEKLPPIGGIANGAMVLRDRSFYEMTIDDMQECLGPKVDGSKYLDEIFSDEPLDFFVMFSSIAWVVGNPGQSNYSAANGFMVALAEARRARGLAASVVSLGVIGGVGYLARTRGGKEHEHAKRRNVMTISPDELCNIFGEAIVAGSPESSYDTELITGLDGTIDTRSTPKESLSAWLFDPRVSHLIYDKAEQAVSSGLASHHESAPLREQLSGAVDEAESCALLVHAFSAKLERMLLLQEGSVLGSAPLTDLGVDSLLAVEIRSWFVKELGVDVPVLRVLGGATATDISELALSLFNGTPKAEGLDSEQQRSTVVSPKVAVELASSEEGLDTPATELESLDICREEVMSYTQARMWRLYDFTPQPHVNNLSWSYQIEGSLDKHRFSQAFSMVIQPFETIRTRYFYDKLTKQLKQEIRTTPNVELKMKDVQSTADIDQKFSDLANAVYDIATGQTMTAVLLSVSPTSHVFACGFHHIAIDTRSCEFLLAELNLAYASPSKYRSPYTNVHTHPADYARLESQALARGEWQASKDFWSTQLRDAPLLLPLLPNARATARRPLLDFQLVGHHEYLTASQLAQIQRLCSSELKCSPYHFHTALFQVLLHALTGWSDLIIGSVDAGRDAVPAFAKTFGPMFNYLPLRFRAVGRAGQTFRSLVRATRGVAYAARAHAQLPFDAMVDLCGEERMPATHHPLYQAQINYLRHTIAEVPLGSVLADTTTDTEVPPLTMRVRDAKGVQVSYDFCVSILEAPDEARIAFETQEYLYGEAEVRALGLAYMRLLDRVLADLDCKVDTLTVAL